MLEIIRIERACLGRRSGARALWWALATAIGLAGSALGAPPPSAQVEIEYLLATVASSDCEFYRNGTWYGATAAAAHLRYKYENLVGKDLIRDATDFIDRAASRSSFSGRPYAMRCAGVAEVSTQQWFTALLQHYRATHATGQAVLP